MKSKFYVIHWKSLTKNIVNVSEFDDRVKAKEFADSLKADKKRVMVCEKISDGFVEKSYRVFRYGDYPFHKWMNVNIGLIILLGLLGIAYLLLFK